MVEAETPVPFFDVSAIRWLIDLAIRSSDTLAYRFTLSYGDIMIMGLLLVVWLIAILLWGD